MKVRKVLIVILVAAISFGFYRFYHHQKSSKMKDNQEILVQPIKPKQSKTKVKRNVTKEAKATLEEPEERVNQKEAEQVKAAIVIPIDYFASVPSQDDIINYLLTFMDYRHSVVDFVIYILFKIGLRPAEGLSLTWNNVNFEKQEIFTNTRWNSVQHKLALPKNDHYYRKINHPNPSVRFVPFDREVKQVLKKLKKQQTLTCELLGVKNDNNFVFFQAGTKWELPDESTVNKRVKKIIEELQIEPVITAYGARHTYGSVKVQDGVPLEVLAKWFGHKDTSMLRCIYIHLLDETRNEWFEKEKMLSGKCSGKA